MFCQMGCDAVILRCFSSFNYTHSVYFIFSILCPMMGHLGFIALRQMCINFNSLVLSFYSDRFSRSQMFFVMGHFSEYSGPSLHAHRLLLLVVRSSWSQMAFFMCSLCPTLRGSLSPYVPLVGSRLCLAFLSTWDFLCLHYHSVVLQCFSLIQSFRVIFVSTYHLVVLLINSPLE